MGASTWVDSWRRATAVGASCIGHSETCDEVSGGNSWDDETEDENEETREEGHV